MHIPEYRLVGLGIQYPADCLCQLLFDKGLHEELSDTRLLCHLRGDSLAMTGTENDRDSSPYLEEFRCKVNSGKVRHCLVRNDKIKCIRSFPEDIQCIYTARCRNNFISKFAQSLLI